MGYPVKKSQVEAFVSAREKRYCFELNGSLMRTINGFTSKLNMTKTIIQLKPSILDTELVFEVDLTKRYTSLPSRTAVITNTARHFHYTTKPVVTLVFENIKNVYIFYHNVYVTRNYISY